MNHYDNAVDCARDMTEAVLSVKDKDKPTVRIKADMPDIYRPIYITVINLDVNYDIQVYTSIYEKNETEIIYTHDMDVVDDELHKHFMSVEDAYESVSQEFVDQINRGD